LDVDGGTDDDVFVVSVVVKDLNDGNNAEGAAVTDLDVLEDKRKESEGDGATRANLLVPPIVAR